MEFDLETLHEKEVPFDLWRDALDLFSVRNQGRSVSVEVKEPGEPDYRVEVTGTALQGVAVADDGDEMRTASFFIRARRSRERR